MAIDIGPCFDCVGIMQISDPPISGDYDKNGQLQPYCNECGGGYKEKIMEPGTIQSTYVDLLSNNKLRNLLHSISSVKNITYLSKKDIKIEIEQMRQDCKSKEELFDYLIKKYSIDIDFLERVLSIS